MTSLHAGATATLLAFTLASATSAYGQARDQIRIVGSSTVFPYSQAVAEQFVGLTGEKSPVVEATGTGGGMKIFCGGVGPDFPDINAASRAMTASEYALCARNGVTSVTEILLGFDGLTIAHAIDAPDMDLSKPQLFEALAARVEVGDRIVPNPYQMWSDIDSGLPGMPIEVLGPPPTSGTRDAFVELVMVPGCETFPAMAPLADGPHAETCGRMRQDGPFIEAGENDNLIVRRLETDPEALGIFGYSFLFENTDRLKPVAVDGVSPSPRTIASGTYELSRPLYLYVKNANRGVIAGLNDFLAEYVSEEAFGPDGYLPQRGLIPLPDAARSAVRAALAEGRPMDRPD